MSSVRRLGMGLALFAGLASLSTKALAQVEVFNAGGVLQNGLTGTSMSNLLIGWYIEVDDKKFSGFTNYSGIASGSGIAVTASEITVTGNENSLLGPGLEYNSNAWTVAGVGGQDTSFNYTVTVLSGLPLLEDTSQTLQEGGVGATAGSQIYITETALTAPGGTSLTNPALTVDQLNISGVIQTPVLFDQQFNQLVSSAYVGKDIGITNNGSTDVTGFSVLYQNFSEVVPEPSSLAIAGLGALGLIGYGLRRRKALGA